MIATGFCIWFQRLAPVGIVGPCQSHNCTNTRVAHDYFNSNRDNIFFLIWKAFKNGINRGRNLHVWLNFLMNGTDNNYYTVLYYTILLYYKSIKSNDFARKILVRFRIALYNNYIWGGHTRRRATHNIWRTDAAAITCMHHKKHNNTPHIILWMSKTRLKTSTE